MRAMAMTDHDSGVSLTDLPTPEAAESELLVRVHGTSLNRFDVLVAMQGKRGKIVVSVAGEK